MHRLNHKRRFLVILFVFLGFFMGFFLFGSRSSFSYARGAGVFLSRQTSPISCFFKVLFRKYSSCARFSPQCGLHCRGIALSHPDDDGPFGRRKLGDRARSSGINQPTHCGSSPIWPPTYWLIEWGDIKKPLIVDDPREKELGVRRNLHYGDGGKKLKEIGSLDYRDLIETQLIIEKKIELALRSEVVQNRGEPCATKALC